MFPQKDLSETPETLKSFFRVISEVIFHICIRLIIRRLNISTNYALTPNPIFLFFDKCKQWHTDDTDTTDF